MSNDKQDTSTILEKPFTLGNILIDPQNLQLSKDQQTISCEPKVFELLLYFCAYPEQLKSRDQLLEDLWQGRVVSDNAVNRKIYQLRKLIQSLDSSIEYIETVPKRGYRLALSPTPITIATSVTDEQITPATTDSTTSSSPTSDTSSRQTLFNKWWAVPFILLFIIMWGKQLGEDDIPLTPKLTPLTSLEGIENYPSVSSDNQLLVYSHNPSGNSHQLKQLHLMTKTEQDLTSNSPGTHDIKSQWHPTENKLAFIRISESDCSIYQISFNSENKPSKPQKIINCQNANLPTISWGAGTNQLFIAERARKTLPYQLYSINTATGAKKQLTHDNNRGNTKGFYYIQRSADGEKLVSLLYISSNQVQVDTYHSHDFSHINSFNLDAHIDAIAWQPDEQAFYFKREQYVEKTDSQGKNRQVVFHIGQDFSNINFAANSNRLLLSSKANITNIYQYNLEQANEELIVSSTKQDKRPAMANHSSKMAFISNRSGTNQFWLSDQNKQNHPMKTIPLDLAYSSFTFSPNDQQLLFEYQDQIYLYDIDTGYNHPIIDKSHQAYHASWSFDGKHIIYGSIKTGDWQLWQLNLNDKSHKQLTTNGGYAGHTDQSGQLYFSKYHHDGLYRLNIDGSETQIIADFSLLNWLNWQIKGETIYYAKLWKDVTKQTAGIYSYHIPSQQQRHIMPLQPMQLHDYTVANDGSFIRYTRLEAQAGDILLLDLYSNNHSSNHSNSHLNNN